MIITHKTPIGHISAERENDDEEWRVYSPKDDPDGLGWRRLPADMTELQIRYRLEGIEIEDDCDTEPEWWEGYEGGSCPRNDCGGTWYWRSGRWRCDGECEFVGRPIEDW